MAEQTLDFDDIQGLIFHGYYRLRYVRYQFIQCSGTAAEARAWLGGLIARISTRYVFRPDRAPPTQALHVALTHDGLRALGFADAELATFPLAFQQGMRSDFRRRILGDTGESAPECWDFAGPKSAPIHALVLLYADSAERRDAMASELDDAMAAHRLTTVHVEDGYRAEDNKEHFGFQGGISQPSIAGSGRPSSDGEAPLAAGEFVLGYRNEYNEYPVSPNVPAGLDMSGALYPMANHSGRRDLGRNGSFLVFRKLQQHVFRFWQFARDHAREAVGVDGPAGAVRLAASMIGRWPSGAPLVLAAGGDNPDLARADRFRYQDRDPRGYACPIGAHIRRINPRDSIPGGPEESRQEVRHHRLIRRSRIYGPQVSEPFPTSDDGVERGTLFLAINGSIQRQFEFLQHTWANNPKFLRLYDDPDPIIGVPYTSRSSSSSSSPSSGAEIRRFTVQARPVNRQIDVERFVTVRGGAYFFLPSIRALRYIADGTYDGG